MTGAHRPSVLPLSPNRDAQLARAHFTCVEAGIAATSGAPCLYVVALGNEPGAYLLDEDLAVLGRIGLILPATVTMPPWNAELPPLDRATTAADAVAASTGINRPNSVFLLGEVAAIPYRAGLNTHAEYHIVQFVRLDGREVGTHTFDGRLVAVTRTGELAVLRRPSVPDHAPHVLDFFRVDFEGGGKP